jgi:hypothetical protein
VLPAVQWIAHFHDAEQGLRRVEAFVTEEPERPSAIRAWTWDFLGQRRFHFLDWEAAAHAEGEAARFAPRRRVMLLWAYAATMAGQHARADSVYRAMLATNSRDPLGWLGLAGTSLRLSDSTSAREAIGHVSELVREPRAGTEIRRHLQHFPEVWPSERLPRAD